MISKTLDDKALEFIANACPTPAHFHVMKSLMNQYTDTNPDGEKISTLIFDVVNRSPFSLTDWIESIFAFHSYLVEGNRKIDFYSMIQYLRCCVASQDAKQPGITLKVLFEDFLSAYGYEAG